MDGSYPASFRPFARKEAVFFSSSTIRIFTGAHSNPLREFKKAERQAHGTSCSGGLKARINPAKNSFLTVGAIPSRLISADETSSSLQHPRAEWRDELVSSGRRAAILAGGTAARSCETA